MYLSYFLYKKYDIEKITKKKRNKKNEKCTIEELNKQIEEDKLPCLFD